MCRLLVWLWRHLPQAERHHSLAWLTHTLGDGAKLAEGVDELLFMWAEIDKDGSKSMPMPAKELWQGVALRRAIEIDFLLRKADKIIPERKKPRGIRVAITEQNSLLNIAQLIFTNQFAYKERNQTFI